MTDPQNDLTGVPRDVKIKVVFDRLIDESTITGKNPDGTPKNFIVTIGTVPIRGSVTVEKDVIAYFKPNSLLDGSSEYECRITGMVKDKQGNALEYEKIWSYKTRNH